MKWPIICARDGCKRPVLQPAGSINRALREGKPLYCGRECAGIARRTTRTDAERKADKAAYDADRRERLAVQLKASKAAYHKRTYDPAVAAVVRCKNMPRHVEYCRQPEYKKWKAVYDRRYRANRLYGEFAEAFMLLQDVDTEINSRSSDYEVRIQNGTTNKVTARKRAFASAVGGEFKDGPLANPARDKGRPDAAGPR